MDNNLSAVLYGKGDLRMENRPAQEPKTGEVQVEVRSAGVCMTDVHLTEHGGLSDLAMTRPYVLGHEFSGVVRQVGPGVTNVKPGHRVTVDSLIACGRCRFCKLGYSNVCDRSSYVGFPHNHGGLARFVTVPAQGVYLIPEAVDFEEAALTEPLSVCVNAAERCEVKVGDSVLVLGAGPIGLMTTQVARARGASIVCVTDVAEDRIALARKLGATHTVLMTPSDTDPRRNARKLRQSVGGDLFDVALECTAVQVCLQTAIHALRPRGVVGLVGLPAHDIAVPIVDVALKEIDLRGCICNNFSYPVAIKMMEAGKVNLKDIISHRFPLDKLHEALDLVRNRKVLKIVIDCSEEKTEY